MWEENREISHPQGLRWTSSRPSTRFGIQRPRRPLTLSEGENYTRFQ
jgi:hypothetical protein